MKNLSVKFLTLSLLAFPLLTVACSQGNDAVPATEIVDVLENAAAPEAPEAMPEEAPAVAEEGPRLELRQVPNDQLADAFIERFGDRLANVAPVEKEVVDIGSNLNFQPAISANNLPLVQAAAGLATADDETTCEEECRGSSNQLSCFISCSDSAAKLRAIRNIRP